MSDIQLSPVYIPAGDAPVHNPQQSFNKDKVKDVLKRLTILFSEKQGQFSDYVANASGNVNKSNQYTFRNFKKYFKKSYIFPLGLAVVAIAGVYLIISSLTNTSPSVLSESDQRVSIKKAKANQLINKEFLFPLKNDKGAEVSRIKYFLQDAQLQDEIVVKGQRATAVKGRTFLIVYIKITNDYSKDISLKTRDYVRLIVNNNSEKIAPDIHNDPVEIQAISTKYTRLGFPINDTDKNLILQIGEISGNKQNIKLDKLK
jgi:hypothetical protein